MLNNIRFGSLISILGNYYCFQLISTFDISLLFTNVCFISFRSLGKMNEFKIALYEVSLSLYFLHLSLQKNKYGRSYPFLYKTMLVSPIIIKIIIVFFNTLVFPLSQLTELIIIILLFMFLFRFSDLSFN